MSVILEFYSLIIRRDRIIALLPGGWPQYLAEYGEPPEGWADCDLVRKGAMNSFDLMNLISHWEGRGFVLQTTKNGQNSWKDMVVGSHMNRLEIRGISIRECKWLQVNQDGTSASFIGKRQRLRERRILSPWPDELITITMETCRHILALSPEDRPALRLKNWDHTFGYLNIKMDAKKSLMITNGSMSHPIQFHYLEDMLNAGWVVD